MIDQVAEGVFEGAGQHLLREIDRDELRREIDGLEAGMGTRPRKDNILCHTHYGIGRGDSTASSNSLRGSRGWLSKLGETGLSARRF